MPVVPDTLPLVPLLGLPVVPDTLILSLSIKRLIVSGYPEVLALIPVVLPETLGVPEDPEFPVSWKPYCPPQDPRGTSYW